MSNAQLCHVLERCIVGTPLREGVTSWLESMLQSNRLLPLAMQGICPQERSTLTQQLHHATQRLFATDESLSLQSTRLFQQDWQTYGERVLQNYLGKTLYFEDFAELESEERIALLDVLGQTECIQQGRILLLLD